MLVALRSLTYNPNNETRASRLRGELYCVAITPDPALGDS
jgi:hypothetical protein